MTNRVLAFSEVADAIVDAIETATANYQAFDWEPVQLGLRYLRDVAEARLHGREDPPKPSDAWAAEGDRATERSERQRTERLIATVTDELERLDELIRACAEPDRKARYEHALRATQQRLERLRGDGG